MKFSLIIPCYNESKNLPALIKSCEKLIKSYDIEVVIVDNGSNDDTCEKFKTLVKRKSQIKLLRVDVNKGYGNGILSGLRFSRGDIIGWTHADMQTNPLDFIEGIKKFEKFGEDIFVKGARHNRPFSDNFFTIGMSIFESLLLKQFMWDINAQPTIFSRKFFNTWNNPPMDFSLDLYAYYMANKRKIRIHRFPVNFYKRAFGTSHWNFNLKSKIKFIIRTINYSFELKSKIDVN